jgi:hypothetical protein
MYVIFITWIVDCCVFRLTSYVQLSFLSTGPIMYGQGLPNDIQMYNYIQMLNYTAKMNLSSGSSSEALNNVTGYSAPNRPQASSLDRINPVLPKKCSSKVSCVKIIA